MQFRQFWIIQCRSSGQFMTDECGYTQLVTKAGRLYDLYEAVETARYHLESDYIVFSAWDIDSEIH